MNGYVHCSRLSILQQIGCMKKLLVLLLLVSTQVNAQKKFAGSLNLQVALPSGEYSSVNGKTGVGGRFNFLYRHQPNIPVSLGLELGYQIVGSRSERFSASVFGFYDEYRLTASNNVFSALLNVRLSPLSQGSAIMPFVDGLIGWNNFFSNVSIERLTLNNDSGQQWSNTKSRWANSYGGSFGVDIALNKKRNTYLELKTAFMQGTKTKYLTDPVIYNDATVGFTELESETNMIIPQVGLHFFF